MHRWSALVLLYPVFVFLFDLAVAREHLLLQSPHDRDLQHAEAQAVSGSGVVGGSKEK